MSELGEWGGVFNGGTWLTIDVRRSDIHCRELDVVERELLAVMGQAADSVTAGAVWLQTSMDTDAERVARLAEEHGITFVNSPVIGTRETAKLGRLVVLASDPATPSTGRSRSSTRSG